LPRRFEALAARFELRVSNEARLCFQQNTAISALCEPCLARTIEAAQRHNAERISPFHQIRSSARSVLLAAAGGNASAEGKIGSPADGPILPPLAASSAAVRRDASTLANAHAAAFDRR